MSSSAFTSTFKSTLSPIPELAKLEHDDRYTALIDSEVDTDTDTNASQEDTNDLPPIPPLLEEVSSLSSPSETTPSLQRRMSFAIKVPSFKRQGVSDNSSPSSPTPSIPSLKRHFAPCNPNFIVFEPKSITSAFEVCDSRVMHRRCRVSARWLPMDDDDEMDKNHLYFNVKCGT